MFMVKWIWFGIRAGTAHRCFCFPRAWMSLLEKKGAAWNFRFQTTPFRLPNKHTTNGFRNLCSAYFLRRRAASAARASRLSVLVVGSGMR